MRLIDRAWQLLEDPQLCKAEIINDHCPYEYGLDQEAESYQCDNYGSCRSCWSRDCEYS